MRKRKPTTKLARQYVAVLTWDEWRKLEVTDPHLVCAQHSSIGQSIDQSQNTQSSHAHDWTHKGIYHWHQTHRYMFHVICLGTENRSVQ